MTQKDFDLLERRLKPIKTPTSTEFKLAVVIVAVVAFEQLFNVYALKFITPDWLSILLGKNQGEYGPTSEKAAAAVVSASMIAVATVLQCTVFVVVCGAFARLHRHERIVNYDVLGPTLRVLAIMIALLFIFTLVGSALAPVAFYAMEFISDFTVAFDRIAGTDKALVNAGAYFGDFISLYLLTRIGASLVNTALGAEYGVDKIWRALGNQQTALLIGVLVLFALRWLTEFLYQNDLHSTLIEPIDTVASYYLLYRLFTIAEKQLETER
ncbi:MAG: hypothetical protein HWE20_02340 [Gammaproteobacteria bacterium]|nr:hypothetical protein [Gammaproteobacteria bacterium]